MDASKIIVPHDINAEKSLISSLLIDNDAFNRLDEVQIQPIDFYSIQHQKIFQAMMDLFEKGEAVDGITLGNLLRTRDELTSAGGETYIATLSTFEFSSANILPHARIVKEKATVRRLIGAATGIITDCNGPQTENVEELCDKAEKMIFDVTDVGVRATYTPIKKIILNNLHTLEQLHDKNTSITGVSTKFTDLDRYTAGLQPGTLVVIAGRPAMGKTSFAMNVAQNAAIRGKIPTVFFSLEMSKEELGFRILTSEAKVSSQRLKVGRGTENEWTSIAKTATPLSEAPLFIDDTPSLTAIEMRSRCRRIKAEHGLGLAVVDYLQLMQGSTKRGGDSREREIADISRALKGLSKELSIPIIALSQLNRGLEARQNKRPMLSDLRESGAIEQDADIVMFIHREEVYNPDTPDKGVAEVILAKHRAGETGIVKLKWMPQYTSFEDLAMMDDYGGPQYNA